MGYGGGCGASKEQVSITEAPVAQSQTPVKVIDAPATKQVSTKQKQTSVTTPANKDTAPTPGPTTKAVAKTEYTNQEANNNMVQGHTKIKTSLSATKLEQTSEADFGSMFFKVRSRTSSPRIRTIFLVQSRSVTGLDADAWSHHAMTCFWHQAPFLPAPRPPMCMRLWGHSISIEREYLARPVTIRLRP